MFGKFLYIDGLKLISKALEINTMFSKKTRLICYEQDKC